MLHVVSFSGGKDSTCLLLMMLEKGMQVDEVIFCDTGKEFPEMYDHIKKVDEYIREHYGKHITVLRAEKSYDYYMFDHVKTKGKRIGEMGYGWATPMVRWCTAMLKRGVINKYLKGKDTTIYIGIAFDEPKRHLRMEDNVSHPLFDWMITEKQALQYCYEHGFDWGGLYEDFDRVSCWCCPLKSLAELRILYHKYPELWKELKDMDRRSSNTFRFKWSVEDLEERFRREDEKETEDTEAHRFDL